MKIISKTFMIIAFLAAVLIAGNAKPVLADANSLLWGGTQGEIDEALELGNEDPRVVAASIINVFLGFLGIIAVVIVLLGGFKWMTAGGNEDQIETAKKLITNGVIGLIIILMSWSISKFVIGLIYNETKAVG